MEFPMMDQGIEESMCNKVGVRSKFKTTHVLRPKRYLTTRCWRFQPPLNKSKFKSKGVEDSNHPWINLNLKVLQECNLPLFASQLNFWLKFWQKRCWRIQHPLDKSKFKGVEESNHPLLNFLCSKLQVLPQTDGKPCSCNWSKNCLVEVAKNKSMCCWNSWCSTIVTLKGIKEKAAELNDSQLHMFTDHVKVMMLVIVLVEGLEEGGRGGLDRYFLPIGIILHQKGLFCF